MNNISAEVILSILKYLPNETDKFSFASVNKEQWRICSLPTDDKLTLKNNITALQLKKYRTIIIQDRHYDKQYTEHVFFHATNLQTIVLDNRQKCTFKFAIFLLGSIKTNKQITLIVPEAFEKKFKCIIEEDNIKNINVKVSGDDLIDVTKILTPESIKKQIEITKDSLKRAYYRNNRESAIMKDNLGHLIACNINRFFNSKKYHLLENSFNDDLFMKKTDLNKSEAERIVYLYAAKFIESVVVLENHWFFMTGFSCFIHNNAQIDNCTDSSKVGYQQKLVAFIRRKTTLGKDYFELTFRFGYVELLATSGFFGTTDGTFFSSFLGSSIQDLPVTITASFETISTNSVFVNIQQTEYIRTNRLLRQYYKSHAKNNWAFYSKRYEDEDFSPANPLSFEHRHIIHSAASFIIRCFTYQELELTKIRELLPKVLAQDESNTKLIDKLIRKYLIFLDQNSDSFFFLISSQRNQKGYD